MFLRKLVLLVLLRRCCGLVGSHHFRRVEIDGFSSPFQVVESTALEKVGGITWPGGRGLATFLASHPHLVRGQSVLELGCGSGLGSLAADALGASSVLATDDDEDALARSEKGGVEKTLRFDFLSEDPLPRADVVIAADCAYTWTLAEHLGRRVTEATERGSRVVVADSQRWRWQTFLDHAPSSGVETTHVSVRSAIRYRVNIFYSANKDTADSATLY